MPYIRDTRRSVGIFDFQIKINDISGKIVNITGNQFHDRVAIGLYNVDIHGMKNCKYPPAGYNILPYYIPFRALTNNKVSNLLVTGRLMSQDFLVNSALRLHPIEWHSGLAAGAISSYMVKNNILNTTSIYLNHLLRVQHVILKHTPICWLIEGKKYPLNSLC